MPTIPISPTHNPGTPGTSPFPPSAPTNLVATRVTSKSITLSWTAATPGCCPIAEYSIGIEPTFSDVRGGATTTGPVTTWTITNYIGPGQQYTISVNAVDTLGRISPSSPRLTVVTPVTDTGPDTVPPEAPTNLTAVRGSAGVELNWSPSTDNVGVVGYNVYHFDGWYVLTLLGTTTGTTFTQGVLPPSMGSIGGLYVRARDAAGNVSIASNKAVEGSSPRPPTSPSVVPPSCRVKYQTTSRWASGFVADLKVTNTGPTSVNGWALSFTFGGAQRVVSAWNATVAQSDADVTLKNVRWNAAIAAGGSTSVGMLGSGTRTDDPPTGFALNGVACTVA